ncbi:TPA: LOW QUALITY PROTEIN: hypothetical protein N0F65_006811 [Lagenidium giganteum]|uniref:PIPK domain-containing protein n=1 Tax=Lagenidium giganteum TaxID=4803 RepID=A0AAV2ZDK2_9STRA|nr:TPA: LOW QUALITY PROTEIN: hypothetical protein N0F65_006811 [Lagenidium giganteum]
MRPNMMMGALTGSGSGSSSYQGMRTPHEHARPVQANDLASKGGMSSVAESSEDSFDSGSYVTDKIHGANEGLGWFHAKIKVESSIQWANNYKIQLFMFLMLVGGAAVTIIMADNSAGASVGLLCGSILTIVACLSVLYTYATRPTWKKHPNPIIFYRSLCDLGLVLVLVTTELYKCGSEGCKKQLTGTSCSATAGLTQFFLWSSESWFFVMAIDMLSSLQSPFTDYKRNVRRYHSFVWATALLTSILLVAIKDFAGPSDFGYCWTRSKAEVDRMNPTAEDQTTGNLWKLNFQSWLLFYIWLIFYWIYAISYVGTNLKYTTRDKSADAVMGVIYVAWTRLHQGLSETLRMRLRVLHSVTIYVIAIIIYWGITFIVYVPYLIQSNSTNRTKWIVQLMNFMITCKGYFDFVVWFQMNEFSDSNAKGSGSKKADVDVDVDLSPQVNLALRCEVLYYTTTGIIQAVRDTQHLPPTANQQELYLQPQGTENNRGSLGVDEYMIRSKPKAALGKGTLFIDYCPHTFQTIREHFGIDTTQYIESLSRTTKERLSEGASGAFMFFSHDQKLIVKSMSNEESAFLRSIAAEYASFLLTNPDSLLTRFYGCHAIRLYGKTFNFVVMANLFSTDKVIHRRYDIKGSWVNRSAKHPSKGKRVTCRHCNAKYVFGSSDAENCRARVGRHEPNVVLKDNDLTQKVRLDPKVAEELYDQLVKDVNFMSRLGIMDYSLLLGVHNVEYTVSPDSEEDLGMQPHKMGPGINRADTLHARVGKGRSNIPAPASSQHKGLPRLTTGTRRANTVVGPSIYYFGLIDILQTWNMDKKLERFAKTKLLAMDPDGLSAIPPNAYCDRFKRKMAEILSVTVREDDFERYSDGELPSDRRFM